jgi:N-alpha-acetyltransferase 15/16, NatA auxiliary subunit
VLENFSSQLPKASAPRRLALTIASGDKFQELVHPYLLNGLSKGIPSLFVDIKSLYNDDSKRQTVEEIVEGIRAEESTKPQSSEGTNSDPTVYVWALYFLSQHYSTLNQPEKALELINLAIEHTPTLPELYTCKGRIYKRAGDPYTAVRCINDARLLDGQDRFLNTKCAKYLFRAGFISEASNVLGLFTKVGQLNLQSWVSLTSDILRKTQQVPGRTLRTCSPYFTFSRREMRINVMENPT